MLLVRSINTRDVPKISHTSGWFFAVTVYLSYHSPAVALVVHVPVICLAEGPMAACETPAVDTPCLLAPAES